MLKKERRLGMLKLRPESIDQLLFLLTKFKVRRKAGDTTTEAQKTATRDTSKKYGVEGPTISDLQTRRLGIKGIIKWRSLLEDWTSGNPEPIKKVILERTEILHQDAIKNFFENSEMKTNSTNYSNSLELGIEESFNFDTSQDTAKKIKVLALMDGISESEWLGKNISEMVKIKYNQWLKSQKE